MRKGGGSRGAKRSETEILVAIFEEFLYKNRIKYSVLYPPPAEHTVIVKMIYVKIAQIFRTLFSSLFNFIKRFKVFILKT